MQRLLNRPQDYVDEMLDGIYLAHPTQVKFINEDKRCLVSSKTKEGKVGIITGGGSGHLPLFLGYVGEGLLDGCCIGGVFQSPSSMQILDVTKEVNRGAGVLYLYGNYGGDIMNFDMAKDMAEMESIEVRQVVAGDDVASSPKGSENKRRGVAGIFYAFKIAGAAAESMLPLAEVERLAQKASDHVRSMGVALTPCTIPELGKANFSISDGEMDLGMGIHGEPGIKVDKLKTADEIVDEILSHILPDLPYSKGDEVSVLVNGLGATPKEELYIVFRRVANVLAEKGISLYNSYVGEFATSMDMAGMSISLLKLDSELKNYLSMPCSTPFFLQNQI
ncbi:PTS-dependent dihydroxyacetone kinase 2, dihydroxyacetone-binding subunit DhaK [Caprobacter fermentans]|uniref:Dihydroxyacetone kinase subunit DhaK n=1 Tax=Caproicibacter fermentans TaxID=2576756 RepID=A0A6N8I570_9FIRM|nr:dihydroxyacetone kinase subunit DhaK [Caproicibacter fermentans]MVB12917.1 PTS-dependent dihydroxyacetone kinase 2, dihydroxyacetone-binding subunit DhaK [Caproicibacter fermentans]OCN02396.1 dihydroxyacetone kinase [Clostridium sp. W14A]QNK41337.1 dihydroxyacetone kinase subunit DhaK [Caproicibacter fermentans]